MSHLTKNPINTGLTLVFDNRSGQKLEIVIPVFNEERRIVNILNYYKGFDVVLLDGGSKDKTIEIALEKNATVYSRVGESFGENHFVYYNNHISKSGYCFYMMADHFINKEDLKKGFEYLKNNNNSVIAVDVVEWNYGHPIKLKKKDRLQRGFKKGYAAFDQNHFHNSLHYIDSGDSSLKVNVCDLHHLHISSLKNEFGKIGSYMDIEIRQLLNEKSSIYTFFRKYLVPIIMFSLIRVWIIDLSISRKINKIIMLNISAGLALMCLVEQKFMPSIEQQSTMYLSKYNE